MKFLVLVLSLANTVSAKCYEASAAHPPPIYDLNDAAFRDALAEIDTAFATTVAAPEYDAASFSVEVTSSKESIWSKHHTARERNTSRPDIPEVNGDAVYRVASVSKVVTVLGVLYQHESGKLSLDEPVDRYIEELREEQEGGVPWKDITLRSIASQLSGIPRDCTLPDNRFCHTLEDLFSVLQSQTPIFAPNQRSTYSNNAYNLLGLATARVNNQSYESYIEEAIFKPLNMSKSGFSPPPDEVAVIPPMFHWWDVDEGVQNPMGGIYSTTSDLSKFLRYILTHYNDITHAVNWLQPVSPARGLNSFYGMPWEIYSTDRILEKSKRAVSFFTKAGGLPGYQSIVITIPDYDLGITILVAGNVGLLEKLQEIVTVGIVRAAEKLAIKQLQQQYTGTYVSSKPDLNTTITLVADERGLVATRFISNGTDFFQSPLMKAMTPEHWYAQLVPTLLDEGAQGGKVWRMLVAEERNEDERLVWDDFCMENIDGPLEGNLPLNKAVFWDRHEEKGAFTRIEMPAFGVNLIRVEGEKDGKQQDKLEL